MGPGRWCAWRALCSVKRSSSKEGVERASRELECAAESLSQIRSNPNLEHANGTTQRTVRSLCPARRIPSRLGTTLDRHDQQRLVRALGWRSGKLRDPRWHGGHL